jgi:hypothetical protein
VLNPSQRSARERRLAAIHEAGHVVIAKHLRLRVLQADIRKNDLQDLDEKEWTGSVRFQTQGVAARKRRMVAVAGLVAESCWEGKDDCHGLFEFLVFNPDGMSESDWEISGCSYGQPSKQLFDAVEQVFELLNNETGGLWNALLLEARRLIVDTRPHIDLLVDPVETR